MSDGDYTPLDTRGIGKNDDGTHDVIVRLRVRPVDELALQSDPHALEVAYDYGMDISLDHAVWKYLTGESREQLKVVSAQIFLEGGASSMHFAPDERPRD